MEADQSLKQAVLTALQATKPSDDLTSIDQYILQLGFDQFSLPNAAPLRQAAGRAILQMVEPRYELIPDDLLNGLRWPTSRRPLLADFLYTLRRELAGHPQMGALIEYCDRADGRKALNSISLDVAQSAVANKRSADYLRSLLLDRGYRFSVGPPPLVLVSEFCFSAFLKRGYGARC